MTRAWAFWVAAWCGAGCAADDVSDSGGNDDSAQADLRAERVADGDPGQDGPYPVGFTTFTMEGVEGQDLVEVEVWYPATGPGTAFGTYQVVTIELPARAYRDAAPDPTAPSFLVAFSHGLGGIRQQNYTMAERLASWGYVVVSPDHPGTTTRDLLFSFGDLSEPLLRRPGTVVAAVDAVLDGAVDGLRPREDGYAMVGHSLGAITALFLGGVVLDPQADTRICGSETDRRGECDLIGELDADLTLEVVKQRAATDDRIVTMVAQAPMGAFAMVDDTGGDLPVPLLMAGARDNPDGTARPVHDLTNGGTPLAVFEGAGHNGATDICDIPVASLLAPDCVGEEGGYREPDEVRADMVRLTVAWVGVHLGRAPSYSAYFGPSDEHTWEVR